MPNFFTCICATLAICLLTVPASASEPSVVLPAFELVDGEGEPVAPVVGATISSVSYLGLFSDAFLLVRFRDPVHSKSLLFLATASGPLLPDTENRILPPAQATDHEILRILYSNANCTGATYIGVPAFSLPAVNHFFGTGLVYSAGVCASDNTRVCIYSTPITEGAISANTASYSIGNTACVALDPDFRQAMVAPEVLKIDSPFPWSIR